MEEEQKVASYFEPLAMIRRTDFERVKSLGATRRKVAVGWQMEVADFTSPFLFCYQTNFLFNFILDNFKYN